MTEQSSNGSERGTAKCPNCGATATDQYHTGNDEIREFDCYNPNCRCEVFRAVNSESDHD